MPYHIVPATPSDAIPIASIFTTAFNTHPIAAHLYPHTPPGLEYADDLAHVTDMLSQPPTYGNRVFKLVTTPTNEVLAFSKWLFPIPEAGDEEVAERWAREEEKGELLEGCNGRLFDAFVNALEKGRREWVDPRKGWFLQYLCVKEGERRRGWGRLLVEHTLRSVDLEGGTCYVEASWEGEGLFRQLGWRVCEEMRFDLREFGVECGEGDGDGVVRLRNYMRLPRGMVGDGDGGEMAEKVHGTMV